MRRIILYFFFAASAFTSKAQTYHIGEVMDETINLWEQNRAIEAYDYWADNSEIFQADSSYAWANAVLAQGFMSQGLFAEAENLLYCAEQSLECLKDDGAWWWQNWGYVSTRKAMLYGYMHDYRRARSSASDAKIAFEHISYRGLDYAVVLSVLSEASLLNGNQILAAIFLGQAFGFAYQVYTTTHSKEHYHYFAYVFRAVGLNSLNTGHYDDAIKLFEILRELNQRFNNNDSFVDYYQGLAYVSNGDYEKAIHYLTSFYETSSVSTDKIISGVNLLYAKYKLGHNDITQLAYDIAKLQSENTSRMFLFMSDQEKEKWWMSGENRIISFLDAILLQSGLKEVNGFIADNEIFSKGLLLRSSNMLKKAALGSKDAKIVESYKILEGLRGKLSETTDKVKQTALENEISSLEKNLQRNLNITIEEVHSWRDVAFSLSNKEVAIEFIRLDRFDDTDNADYYAILVKKGVKEPIIVHLFEESSIKSLLENQTNKPVSKYVFELYSSGQPYYKGDKLYDLIWSKLEKEIKGYKIVYYSLAGVLNSISLQALSDGKQYVGQKYLMHLVSSIGEIPNLKAMHHCDTKQAVIYGGIQYDANESEIIQAARSYSCVSSNTWWHGLSVARSGWNRLPGTEIEASEVDALLANRDYVVQKFSGIEANEESFKALSGKELSIIHIATHGFYLSEQREINRNAFLNPLMSETVGRVDPMLRSGLLFSGANRVWTGKSGIDGIEDGILTAKEVTNLDFSKVGLIVLSACQTALGEVEANEGVYGLQRAFKLAGAETLIMSLWEVDDQATSLLMKFFYEEYLNGNTKDCAFRAAVNKVRTYKDESNDEPFSSPYYWAAFIMLD